ncbi:MAG: trigger factor [Patescibacteria group bacterium]
MNVSVKKLPESQVEITVTLAWEEWKGELDHAAESLAKEVKVPGFRSGKVPRGVLEQRYGKGAVIAEAAEHAVGHSYPKVLAEQKVDAIGYPAVSLGKVAEGEELIYTVTTAVMPKVVLKPWKDALKKINATFAKGSDAVEEKEIDEELQRIAASRAKSVPVEREAKLEDSVLVDFTVMQDGVLIENGKSEKHPLVLGKGVFIPGFEEEVIGMKEGDEKTFTLTFPAEYHAKHLAGKPAQFTVMLRSVEERQIPEINDEFAQSLGNFDTLEKLKENLRNGLGEEKKAKRKEDHRAEILDALVGLSEIEYPIILVEQELGRMLQEFQNQIQGMGFDFATYLEQTKKTEEDLRKEWEPQAKKRLAANLALDTLAEEEEITVETAEIEEEMNKALQYFKSIKDAEKDMDLERLYSAVQGQLRNEKVFLMLEAL